MGRRVSSLLVLAALLCCTCTAVALSSSSENGQARSADGSRAPATALPHQHALKVDEDSDDSHKPLWPPSVRDFWLLGGVAVTSLLAANAGIGGGGILLPLLVFAAQFTPRLAAALSNVCILGGSIANFMLNVQRRHPVYPTRPLIDYDLILMMEPPTVLGALVGGFANKILGTWITSSFMFIILACVAYELTKKALTPKKPQQFEQGRSHPYPQRSSSLSFDSANGSGSVSQHRGRDHTRRSGGTRQQHAMNGHAVTIPMEEPDHHHQHAALSMEPIEEGSSVHYGIAPSRSVSTERCSSSRIDKPGGELRAAHDGIAAYRIAVEDHRPGRSPHCSPHRKYDEQWPNHVVAPDRRSRSPKAEHRGPYKLPYQLRIEDEKEDVLVEELQQDKLLEQPAASSVLQQQQPLQNQQQQQQDGQRRKRSFTPPWPKLGWLAFLSLWVAASQLAANTVVECGSPAYWLAILSTVPVAMLVLLHTRSRVLRKYKHTNLASRARSKQGSRGAIVQSGEELLAPLLDQSNQQQAAAEAHQQQPPPHKDHTHKDPQACADGVTHAAHTALQLPHPGATPFEAPSAQAGGAHGSGGANGAHGSANANGAHGSGGANGGAVSGGGGGGGGYRGSGEWGHVGEASASESGPAQPEIAWTPKTTLLYPAMCSGAGLVAGVCGVGGGIIKGPLMLSLGVRPEVAAATSATMILATSCSATTVYAGLGAFKPAVDYTLAMATLGFMATALGQTLLHMATKRMQQQSQSSREEKQRESGAIILKIMAIIMVMSAVSMGYAAALEVRKVVKHPELAWKFGHICGGGGGVGVSLDPLPSEDMALQSMDHTLDPVVLMP